MLRNILLAFIPVFIGFTLEMADDRKKKVILRSTATTGALAVVFVFLGKAIFRFLGIEIYDFMTAGGARPGKSSPAPFSLSPERS